MGRIASHRHFVSSGTIDGDIRAQIGQWTVQVDDAGTTCAARIGRWDGEADTVVTRVKIRRQDRAPERALRAWTDAGAIASAVHGEYGSYQRRCFRSMSAELQR